MMLCVTIISSKTIISDGGDGGTDRWTEIRFLIKKFMWPDPMDYIAIGLP